MRGPNATPEGLISRPRGLFYQSTVVSLDTYCRMTIIDLSMTNRTRSALVSYARQVLAFGLLCWPAAAYIALGWAGF